MACNKFMNIHVSESSWLFIDINIYFEFSS